MKTTSIDKIKHPERISTYFLREKWVLIMVSVSGILYNIGMIAGPWFEGQLVQRLLEVLDKKKTLEDMIRLACIYVVAIFLVQFFRYIKRLYVRKFANHVNRDMKQILYAGILHKNRAQLDEEGVGNLMTKAISDIDLCSDGMRKFVTEIFDTGVVMLAYMGMLLYYDYRLALLSAIFPPIAYVIAEKLKKPVTKCVALYKESAGKLNNATMDRVSNELTYRIYGQEEHQNELYEESLKDYSKKAVYANIWENAMQPLYRIIAMMSLIFIFYFGAKNVLGEGFCVWDIAAFTTFLSCFTKMAAKSSRSAKLFNAIQKAAVSWKRICPFLNKPEETALKAIDSKETLSGENITFGYLEPLFTDVNFSINPGEIVGITGPVACGKTTFGQLFLGELAYKGIIKYGKDSIKDLIAKDPSQLISYMGHQPQLLSTTIEENIQLGVEGDIWPYLQVVCMDQEVKDMPAGIKTVIGNGGVRLSGGQQARIALARTMYHKKAVVILDDPFSAVDTNTEQSILQNLHAIQKESMIILISHRLLSFPTLSQVFYMEDKRILVSTHENLMNQCDNYKKLFLLQQKGGNIDEE